MKNKWIGFLSILGLVMMLSCLIAVPAAAVGLGVGPSPLTIEQAIPGKEYIKSIYISSSFPADTVFTLSASGDIASWVTFYPLEDNKPPITEVTITAGGDGAALVKFVIPQNALPQIYTGKLFVTAAPVATGSEGASVQLQMPIDVAIQITGGPPLSSMSTQVTTTTSVATVPIKSGDMNLISLNYDGKPQTGDVTKLTAVLHNLTQQDTETYLLAEVYLKDKLVDTIKSDVMLISVGTNKTITAYYKPVQAGDYTIKGWLVYEGKETDALTIQMKVAGGGGGISPFAITGISVGALLLIGGAFFGFSRKRK